MRYRLSTLSILLAAALGLVSRAAAGPPLICHPFEIGTAQSLPWAGGPNWHSPSPGYDTNRLVDDTLALLDAKAPMTALLILFEMTNDYRIMLPLMAATVASTYVSHHLLPQSIYTLKLHQRGISFPRHEPGPSSG